MFTDITDINKVFTPSVKIKTKILVLSSVTHCDEHELLLNVKVIIWW